MATLTRGLLYIVKSGAAHVVISSGVPKGDAVMQPILCVVGAGVHPVLTTAKLTSELKQWRGALDPTTAGPETQAGGEWIGWPSLMRSPRKPFYAWLEAQLVRTKNAHPELNFEDLIQVVDAAYSALGRIPARGDNERSYAYTSDTLAPTELGLLLASQSLELLTAHSRKFILTAVSRLTANHRPLQAARLLAELARSRNNKLWVFSLNYDTLVTDEVETEWWTGYPDASSNGAIFQACATIPHNRDINVQMHGSVYLGTTSLDIVTRFRRYKAFSEASETWLNHHFGSDVGADGVRIPTVPMITGRRKADELLVEPFASYLQYFRQAALSTPHWLILGYGGSDAHINHALQAAADKWGGELRVVVCNYLEKSASSNDGAFLVRRGSATQSALFRILRNPFNDAYNRFLRDAPERSISRSAGTKLGDVLLTLDGRFLEHQEKIQYWLS